ncbi:MAG: amidohydrolase [Chloroflexi bacterium]|nr:amidohydrolase [Chloroflexota bacterium]
MSSIAPDLILHNASVITLNPSMPRASWVAIDRGMIVGAGTGEPPIATGGFTKIIDCQGSTLIPGFNDAHCHVLATAASLLAVDCSPAAVSSIEDIRQRLRERSVQVAKDTWLRGMGYNDFYLQEKRHPTRWDLDQASPDNPIRLLHRSGHAMVLNSRALALASIHRDTSGPEGGVIEREEGTGEPTGLLLEMSDYLDGVIPPLSSEEIERGIGRFNERCLALGITSIQDATPGNNLERWKSFERLKERGLLTPSVTFMAGAGHLHEFLQEGFTFGYGAQHGLRLGAAKIMVTMTTGSLRPSREDLRILVREAHINGFQVAIHAVEAEAVEEAIDAIRFAIGDNLFNELRHRIEHCSECPPHLVERLARSGITVVTQPGFLYYSGERYLAEVPDDRLPWLYPIHSLQAAGVPIAAGSDAPVIQMNPIMGIYAAATRRSESGGAVLPGEVVGVEVALHMYTLGSAYASFEELVNGSIQAGKRADLVLLDRDPTTVDPEEIKDIRVIMTVARGQVVWEG